MLADGIRDKFLQSVSRRPRLAIYVSPLQGLNVKSRPFPPICPAIGMIVRKLKTDWAWLLNFIVFEVPPTGISRRAWGSSNSLPGTLELGIRSLHVVFRKLACGGRMKRLQQAIACCLGNLLDGSQGSSSRLSPCPAGGAADGFSRFGLQTAGTPASPRRSFLTCISPKAKWPH